MANRTRFDVTSHSQRLEILTAVHIFVHPQVRKHPARAAWASPGIYKHCPQCQPISNSASAQVNLFHYSNFPTDQVTQKPRTVFAMINMEAHSYHTIPPLANNTVVISYLGASDLPISYCCAFGLARRQCNVSFHARAPARLLCLPPAPPAPRAFHSWCRDRHGGDFLTCAFGLMPLLLRSSGARAARPLAAAWVSASCARHGGFLAELMRHMPVDMMGACHRNRHEARHLGLQIPGAAAYLPAGGVSALTRGERKVLLGSQYRFYISVENTLLDDYITEKFYQGFLMDSVMVYLGAPNAAAHAPAPRAFVDAAAFAGPRELAVFLHALAADEARYAGYLAWKSGPGPVHVSEAFLRAMRESDTAGGRDSVPCRLCRLVTGGGGSGGGKGAAYGAPAAGG